MFKRGNYVEIHDYLYRVIKRDDRYIIISDNKESLKKGFVPYKESNDTFIKILTKKEISKYGIYKITPKIFYNDLFFSIKEENESMYYIGTSNFEIAQNLNFEHTDKYFYEKWIQKKDGKLVEEKEEIELNDV